MSMAQPDNPGEAPAPPNRRRDGRHWWRAANDLSRHPKLLALPPKVRWMWIDAMCHASSYLTDGFISDTNAAQIGPDFARNDARKCAWDQLVFAGLAERVTRPFPGYQMKDYLEHQEAREQVERVRSKRAEAGRRGGLAKALGKGKGVATATAVAQQRLEQTPSKTEEETRERDFSQLKDASRGSSIPPNFVPSMRDLEWARQHAPAVNTAAETRNFVDYWTARPASRRTDWHEEWRIWIRRCTTPRPTTKAPVPVDASKLTPTELEAILGYDSWCVPRGEYPGDIDDLDHYGRWCREQTAAHLQQRRAQAAQRLAGVQP